MCSSGSSNDTSTSACDRDGVKSSNKIVSTSCDQKVENCNDSASDNTASNSSAGVDLSGALHHLRQLNMKSDINTNNYNDELFQDPPPKEDCPICMLPMPHSSSGCGVDKTYMPCCGKMICEGCCTAEHNEMKQGNIKPWCAFCRVPLSSSDEELIERLEKRMKFNDDEAFYTLGMHYRDGYMGLPQDINKANESLHKAAELGSCNAHTLVATAYMMGDGVEQDREKGIHHLKLAAMGGHEQSRYFLGLIERKNGHMNIAIKHFMISARSGYDDALKKVGEGYKDGHVNKDDYAATLSAYRVSCDDMKSKQRDIAAAQR